MKDKEQTIDNIIEHISKICNNNNIISHCKKIIQINNDYIIELNNKCLRARRYEEVLEINISDNYFTIYETEWGTTSRRKTTCIKLSDNVIISFDDNEIKQDGNILVNYTYIFKNEKCLHASYSKKVDLEYELNNQLKIIKKDEHIDIYPIDGNKALKKIEKNGTVDYFFTHVGLITLNNINNFEFINSKMDEKINCDCYQQKIKKLKAVIK